MNLLYISKVFYCIQTLYFRIWGRIKHHKYVCPLKVCWKGFVCLFQKLLKHFLANTRNFFQSCQFYDAESNNGKSGDDGDDYEMKNYTRDVVGQLQFINHSAFQKCRLCWRTLHFFCDKPVKVNLSIERQSHSKSFA